MKLDTKKYLEANFRSSRKDLAFGRLFDAAIPYFEAVNTPVSLGCYLRLKYSSYEEYLDMSIDPNDYKSPDDFHHDYQCAKLFSKAEFFPNVYDVKKEAMSSFIDAEERCRQTNNHFINRDGPLWGDHDVRGIFHAAGRKVSAILGDCPGLEELPLSFGPGNNVGLSRTTSIYDKLNASLTHSPEMVSLLPDLFSEVPAWACLRSSIAELPTPEVCGTLQTTEVPGSILGFVPKNAKTHRSICTEPLLNSFVQKGIGTYMRRLLRAAGCNLDDQGRNQELARKGSLTGSLATIDLSAASDTISFMVVQDLLPAPWFHLLDTVRSQRFTFDDITYHFEKFSSMGNAFTFELESLIFLALARSTCAHLGVSNTDVSVYGDDIIIPVEAVSLFVKVLDFCGFKVNESKSFHTGPFRESCGKDWYLGELVRPVFLKKKPTNQILMSWCNHIYRYYTLFDFRAKALYDSLKKLVPKSYHRLVGPDGYGDGHFIAERDFAALCKDSRRARGWEGFAYFTLSSTPIIRTYTDTSVYCGALYGASMIQPLRVRRAVSLGSVVKYRADTPSVASTSRFADDRVSKGSTRSGYFLAYTRGKVRTTLRRQFHPWS